MGPVCERFAPIDADPLKCANCGAWVDKHQRKRVADAQDSGAQPIGTPYPKGKSGNPGGQPKWVKKVRDALKKDANVARRLLNRVMRGKDILGGAEAREVKVSDSVKAAEVVLKFTLPMPKQTHRVEGKGGDPLGVLTAEQLVAFLTGRKGHE